MEVKEATWFRSIEIERYDAGSFMISEGSQSESVRRRWKQKNWNPSRAPSVKTSK